MKTIKPLTEMAKHSDGEPVLKTNYKDPAKRYELAERMVWSKLDKWKKQVIIHCKLTNKSDRILDEYGHEIAVLAESDDKIAGAENLPPVPAYTLESERSANKAQPLQN
ncbi:MAG: hypothetical protein ACREGC_04320 [Minisyncoccia bacterium]